MNKVQEKIPVSGIIMMGVLSFIILGVLPTPFVLLSMRYSNKLVDMEETGNSDLTDVYKKRIRWCRICIIIGVVIELVVFVLVFRSVFDRFLENLQRVYDGIINSNSGCSEC